MTPGYLMGSCADVSGERIKAFFAGQTADLDDLVLLAQDILETGVHTMARPLGILVLHMTAMHMAGGLMQ